MYSHINQQSHIQNQLKMQPKGAADMPLSIRAIIISMRYYFNVSWEEIGNKLHMSPDTARQFYARTQ